MGRAIDMENQLDNHESKIKKLEKLVFELEDTLDAILEAVPGKKEVKLKEENKDAKKTDNKGTSNSSKQSNKRPTANRKSNS